MRAYSAYRGFPRLAGVANRRRLVRLLDSMPAQGFTALTAPSGYGKTVAAAQFAESVGMPSLWIGAGGEDAEIGRLLSSVVVALRVGADRATVDDVPAAEMGRRAQLEVAAQLPAGAVVVLDDLCGPSPEDLSRVLNDFASVFQHFGLRLLVTTRQGLRPGRLCRVVDESNLRFSNAEAILAAEALGLDQVTESKADAVLRLCSGHPALTTTLLAAPSEQLTDRPAIAALSRTVEQITDQALSAEAAELFGMLRMLRRVPLSDLTLLGFEDPLALANEIVRAIPLVKYECADKVNLLVSHDLLALPLSLPRGDSRYTICLDLLANGEDGRLLSSALKIDQFSHEAVEWLGGNCELAMRQLGAVRTDQVLSALPLSQVVSRPRLMLLWAQVLRYVGNDVDALTKAKISSDLAAHEQDLRTLGMASALRVSCIASAGNAPGAMEVGEDALSRLHALQARDVRCELLVALANAAAGAGQDAEFAAYASAAREVGSDLERARPSLKRLRRAEATLYGLGRCDWKRSSQILLPMLQDDASDDLFTWITVRGNAACCLAEMGRLSRARALLSTILDKGMELADGSYLPVLGTIFAAQGDSNQAEECFRRGIQTALSYGDEVDSLHSRIWLATARRANNRDEDSLESAERAYEGLCSLGAGAFQYLAGLEVAASLLRLGDVAGCSTWIGGLSSARGLEGYTALRLGMVESLMFLRDSGLPAAIERLAAESQEILSGNSNWQLAMYCRAFPELLGMLAMAVGAKNLPVHMLRMILPEQAEQSLSVSRDFMDEDEWQILGRRLLGDDQFAIFVARKGKPMLRVRLFGGFEAVVGERALRERDWTKRKGRVIFAMLVARQGQEVARDQILEHLWPELSEEKAKNNFYVAWSTMKAALAPPEQRTGPCPYVESARGRCRLVTENVRSDIEEFNEAVERGRRAEAEGRDREAVEAYGELLRIYRGDLLPGDVYDDWFAPLRDKYRFEFVDAMMRAIDLLVGLDDPCEALVFARRGISVDPYREDLYQAALRCHMAAGQRSAAIEMFIQCRTQLADELGLDPSNETMALYQQILAMEERPRWDSYGLDDA